MKKQLQKKLSSCLPTGMAFIVSAMMFTASVNAQIVYTDVNPDVTSTGTYNLDLNNDGTNDFVITHSTAPAICWGPAPIGQPPRIDDLIRVTPSGTNQIVDYLGTNATKMALNAKINAAVLTWNNNVNQLMARRANYPLYCRPDGQWINAVDGYLGLKLISGGNTYYGWVKISTSGALSFTIKDYAYNPIPNQPILAGETSCTTPTVSLTQSGSLSFCNGDSVTLTANGTGYLYQWRKDNVNIAGATAKTYVAKIPGAYRCNVTNSCGSKRSGARTVAVPCRLSKEAFTEQLVRPNELKIAPNPIRNAASISFSLKKSEKVSISIFDLNGRLIEVLANNIFKEGKHLIDWNAESVNAGVYILKLQSGGFLKTERLIVTK